MNKEKIIILKKRKIYEYFQEINENNDLNQMNKNQLSEYITMVREETSKIIKINQIEFENDSDNNNCNVCYGLDYCNIC